MPTFQCEITIDAPRQRVVERFQAEDSATQWQPSFQGSEHLSGEKGQAGSQSAMRYLERGRELVLTETIVKNDLPETFIATYEGGGVFNHITNTFTEESPTRTRWTMVTDFRFQGMMRLIGPLMGGAFRKQSEEDMARFKAYAESAS